MNNSEFPDYALRGLTTKDCIDPEFGYVTYLGFTFEGNHYNENNYDEISVNWYDSEEALNEMKDRKKKDLDFPQFSNGIARIPTSSIKKISNKYRNELSYERKPVDGNIFHGNILLHKDIASKIRNRAIAAELANSVDMLLEYFKDNNEWKWKEF